MKPTANRRVAPDSRILKMREYEDRHRALTEATVAQQQVMATAEWEMTTDKRIKAKVIQGRFQHLKNREEQKLEERRERLAEMLRAEEVQFQQVRLRAFALRIWIVHNIRPSLPSTLVLLVLIETN